MNLNTYWSEKIISNIAGPYMNTNVGEQILEEYSTQEKTLDAELANRVLSICNRKDYLLNIFFLCCVGRVLHKHEFRKEIILCQPVCNNDFDLSNINNILLIRSVLKDDDSFKDYLLRTQEEYKESYTNINYDVRKLLNLNAFSSAICLKGFNDIGVECIENPKCTISFSVIENSMLIEVEYNSTLYASEFIRGFICQIEMAIINAVDNTSVQFSHTDVCSDTDRIAISMLNDTAADFGEETIIDMYYNVYNKRSDDVAIISNGNVLTYSQLEQYSNALAEKISKMGIIKGDLVGIVLPRTEYLFVTQLAILKLGCAYVPIDPSYPPSRVYYIIEKSFAKAIVTVHDYLDSQIENIIHVDSVDWNESCSRPDVSVYPDDLAYVIFTSGSTGDPKGVMISHLALANFSKSVCSKIGISMTKKILSVTTISFDIFVLESLLPLSNGMTIVLADELSQNNPVSLAKLITESGVNVLQMTPSRMKMLVDNEKFCKAIKNIEYILIGGESFPSVLLHQLSHITNATIFNMYGPTETTVWSSMKRLTAKVHITIGRPIHNTEIVILDQYNQMQPIGVPGELCIAGTGLSNGYLNNEILTNDRFVMWHGKKIFKTGDIAFLNPCNEIVCMGRLDNQVKIRGYRIELAEIEEAMMNFRGIVLSAVIVNIDQFDEKYLSAYFEADMEIDLCELKGNLQTILPEYMVPSFFYQVEKIPFTPNLKVDRKRLLEVPCIALNNKIIIRPKNEVQSIILEHWRSFLNVQDIGIKDNFFDIGGDSLKAVQITTQLLDKFDIDANAIFKYPTVVLLEKNINYKSDNFNRYISTQRFYAKKINSIVNDMQYQADYREYMKKNLQICSLDLSSKYNHRNILVTGASGNLGIHLVHELINTSSAHVYLLVRENSSMDAKTRIENLYSKYFGGVEYVENKKRIHIVNANIEYNRLGLDDSFYMDLAQKIDCIFHAAAKVSHYGTYSDFYSINVRGTENLIEFALNGKQIIFNYISTQGIGYRIPNTTHRILFTEFDDVEDLPIENYYLQTKAETENLVKAAGNQGLEYRIYRIGNLFIDSKNGDMPENFLNMSIYRVLRAFMNIGVIPNLSYPIFDFSFIDDVSRAIISLANVTCVTNQVFHVSNSERVLLPQLGAMLKNSCNNCSIIDVEDFFNIVVKNYSMQTYIDEITDLILFFHIPKMFIERTNERTNMILERIGFQWHSLECRHLESIKSAFKSNL